MIWKTCTESSDFHISCQRVDVFFSETVPLKRDIVCIQLTEYFLNFITKFLPITKFLICIYPISAFKTDVGTKLKPTYSAVKLHRLSTAENN